MNCEDDNSFDMENIIPKSSSNGADVEVFKYF